MGNKKSNTSASGAAALAAEFVQYDKLIEGKRKGKKTINGIELVGKKLGEGGLAEVQLGKYVDNNNNSVMCALKIMSKSSLKRKREHKMIPGQLRPKIVTGLDKVYAEIEFMKGLTHPNIIQLYAVIDDPEEDMLVLVLEYADMGQIMDWNVETETFQVANTKPNANGDADMLLPTKTIRNIVQGCVDALSYLHAKQLIHRDIKPQNLLINSEGVVKIADFGCCKQLELEVHGADGVVSDTEGTFHFFCPEACNGEKYSGYNADVWALGVTIFCMVYGTLPWMDEEGIAHALFQLIATQPLVFPDETPKANEETGCVEDGKSTHVDAGLKDLISKMLGKDASKRLSLKDICAHTWMENGSSN